MSNKYNARRTVLDGHTFASQKEARHYILLKARQQAGEISRLELQPRFDFIINGPVKMRNGHTAHYTADFSYWEDNARVVVEVKGMEVRDYPLRRAIFLHLFPGVRFLEV